MEMEYVYVIGGIFVICLLVFFRYMVLHCSQTYHPTVHMMRPGGLTPNVHVLPPRSGFPFTISGTLSTYNSCVGPAPAPPVPGTPLGENGPYAPVYALRSDPLPRPRPLPGSLIPRQGVGRRPAGPTTLTSHGPPDYETVMAGCSNPAFVRGNEDLHGVTPPPSYDSVIASLGHSHPSGIR